MVIRVITHDENIFMDNVVFVNESELEVSVTTKDGMTTEIASPEFVDKTVYTDNGVMIYPEPRNK